MDNLGELESNKRRVGTLTLTLFSHSDGLEKKEKKEEQYKAEGEGVDLPRRASGCPFASAGEEAEPGELPRRAWPRKRRSQAARRWRAHPLGNAHAGEGVGNGAVARCSTAFARSRLRSPRCCVRREERER